ncbi:rhodanese-like domain-containing protein [Hirsutella rhossiliensis]
MSTAAGAEQQADSPPWWASLPEPKASCRRLEPADVMQLLESQSNLDARRHRSFLLVDVRRTDWEGGTLASSINLPAQSFYQTRPVVYQLCKQAGVKTIIFYCGENPKQQAFPITRTHGHARAHVPTHSPVSKHPPLSRKLIRRRELNRSRPEVCWLDAGLL